MSSRGFPYTPVTSGGDAAVGYLRVPRSIAEAAQFGLGFSQSIAAAGVPDADPNVEYAASLPPAEHEAYAAALGPMYTGCAYQALVKARGSAGPSGAAVAPRMGLHAALASSPTLAAARSEWRSCMSERDFPVSKPSDVLHQLATALGAGTAAERANVWADEQRAARAVAECNHSTIEPVLGEWARIEKEWYRRYKDVFDSMPRVELLNEYDAFFTD